MLFNKFLSYYHNKRKGFKNKKGGINILMEFIALLPFFFLIVLMLIDVLKFYYLHNLTSLAAYHASYNFSMTTNVDSAMKEALNDLKMGSMSEAEFRSNDVKVTIYQYDKTGSQVFSTKSKINVNKTTNLTPMPGIIVNSPQDYDNSHTCNREIYGFEIEIQNTILTAIPAASYSAGAIGEIKIPVKGNNHIFELQRLENNSSKCS